MEFQLSKTTKLVSIYDIGETIEIIGFSKVVDGKNKIKNMIKNIQQMKSLSDENIRQAEKYSFEKIAKEYDEFFTKVMEEQK